MTIKRLSAAMTASPPGKIDGYTWDMAVQGFGVRKGKLYHSFVIQFRDQAGKTKRPVIGRVGHMTFNDAQAEAQRRLSVIAQTGRDPGPPAKLPPQTPAETLMVDAVIAAWTEAAAQPTYRINGKPLAASTLEFTRSNMARIRAVWGGRPALDLTTAQVEQDIKTITHGVPGQYDPAPALARNLLSNLRTAWRWARKNRPEWNLPDVQMREIEHVRRGKKRSVRLTDRHYRAVITWLNDFHRGECYGRNGKRIKRSDFRRQAAYIIEIMMRSGRRKLQVATLRTDMLFPSAEAPDYIATTEKVAESGRIHFAGQDCHILRLIREAMAFKAGLQGDAATSPWLFDLHLHHDPDRRERAEQVNDFFAIVCREIGIEYDSEQLIKGKLKRVTQIPYPHDLRRGYAHACYRAGMTPLDAAKSGGWAGTQAMIDYYLEFDRDDHGALAERRHAMQNQMTGDVAATATITLPADLQAMLTQRAADQGCTLAELLERMASA